jgi:hypothetical protein
MLHYTVNQRPHWARRQYGHSGGTLGWLGVERLTCTFLESRSMTVENLFLFIYYQIGSCPQLLYA